MDNGVFIFRRLRSRVVVFGHSNETPQVANDCALIVGRALHHLILEHVGSLAVPLRTLGLTSLRITYRLEFDPLYDAVHTQFVSETTTVTNP